MTRREAEIGVAVAELARAKYRAACLAGEAGLLAAGGGEPEAVVRRAAQEAQLALHDVAVCEARLALAESDG